MFLIPKKISQAFDTGFNIPWWFQLLVGCLPIPAVLKMSIEACYVIWRDLPWFHKNGALIELRKACSTVRGSYANRPAEVNVAMDESLNSWCRTWNPMTRAKRTPTQEHF